VKPRDYLAAKGVETAVVQAISLVLVAAVATSRAREGLVAPGFLAAMVAVAAVAAAFIGRTVAQFEAAHDVLAGTVDVVARPAGGDAFSAGRLRTTALVWALGLGLWGGAGGLLVAGALRGHHAPFPVTAVALVVFGGGAATVAGLAGRVDGLLAAGGTWSAPRRAVALRRRAWRELALPAAVVQVALNAGFAVVLFHDRTTGDALAQRPLTESIARADALVVVTLLTALFAFWATRWGRVDAALGTVAVEPDVLRTVDRKHPLGPQALVYIALAGLIVWTLAGWVMPPLPSLTRVAIVRGLFAGALTFAVVGVAHVRGALNTLAGASPLPPPATRPELAMDRGKKRPRFIASSSSVALLCVVIAVSATALAQETEAPAAAARLSAEGDAFVARVEYDIPLPAGSGSIAQVGGRIGAPTAENAYGVAASPTRMDAVVSGVWFNPLADEDPIREGQQAEGPIPIPDENRIPIAECFHPGNDLDVRFAVPNDLRDKFADAPVLGYATAHCGAGPESEVHARAFEGGGAGTVSATAGPVVTSGPAGGDGLFRPDGGELIATASAWANGVSILGGVVRIGSVSVEGASAVTGKPGDQRSHARVRLQDVSVAGVTFALDGDRMVIAGQAVALDSLPARTVLDAVQAALRPLACRLTIVGSPDRYPQGFVLGREEPEIALRDDGTLASSMAGGLLVVCDMDERLTTPTGFSPQRLQVLVGFVYTSASAVGEVGGFGVGDIAGDAPPAGDAAPLPATPPAGAGSPSSPMPSGSDGPAPASAPDVSSPAPDPAPSPPSVLTVPFRAITGTFGEWPVWFGALVVWLLATHTGVRRVQRRLAEVTS
jgi:hypothetical protein